MKKSILGILGILTLSGTLVTSCTSDSNGSDSSSSTFVVTPTDFKGTITEGEVVLVAGTIYKLTGKIQVNSGATLTIPAGTVIEAMLLEIPVITYKTTGTPYLNKDGETVLLCDIGDINQLAKTNEENR
jgi:glycosyltransferase involved in cell wall biosynthesis